MFEVLLLKAYEMNIFVNRTYYYTGLKTMISLEIKNLKILNLRILSNNILNVHWYTIKTQTTRISSHIQTTT
jgi:hypothetical protein